MAKKRRGLGLLLVGASLAVLAAVRKVSLKQAAEVISNIPRGAMAIRRESLLDITVPGRPFRQTVFIAESTDQQEVIGGETEDLSPRLPTHDPDPSEDNVSGTMTGLLPAEPNEIDGAEIDAAELHAEAEAVLAEAERIEEEAVIEGVIEEELAEEVALEESMDASDDWAFGGGVETERAVKTDEDEGQETAEKTEPEPEPEPEEPPVPVQVSALDGACPESHPIKVRFATGRYHEPGTAAYEDVVADACYKSVEAAENDGFSASPL